MVTLGRTDAHKIKDDRPPLRRAREYVLKEALRVGDEGEDEPEAERPLCVDVPRAGELRLRGYAQKKRPEAW